MIREKNPPKQSERFPQKRALLRKGKTKHRIFKLEDNV